MAFSTIGIDPTTSATVSFVGGTLLAYYLAVFPLVERRRAYVLDERVAGRIGRERTIDPLERLREHNGPLPLPYRLLFPPVERRVALLRERSG